MRPDQEPEDRFARTREFVSEVRDAQQLDEQQRAALQQLTLHGRGISERGIATYGRQTWDEAASALSRTISKRLGCSEAEAQMRLTHDIRNYDDGGHIVMHLADNADRFESLMGMSAEQQKVELARVEAEASSHGRRIGGKRPAWMLNHREGRVSDSDWNRSGGNHLNDLVARVDQRIEANG